MTSTYVEPIGQVRTKIVATLGPASADPGTVRALIDAGVDVIRLNFAHGAYEEHAANLALVRKAADEAGRTIAVLVDLGGPKIRLGPIPGGEIECAEGDEFLLSTARRDDDPRALTCTYRDLPRDLSPDDLVVFADGAVSMSVAHAGADSARLRVIQGGRLRGGQGLNLPGVNLRVRSPTEKDLRDLDWLAEHPVELIGQSFVRSGADVARLRAEMEARGLRAYLVAKVEKPQAVDDLAAILLKADAVMIARGDLGVEMDVARVPAIQKRVIAACHAARMPVIVATQMLASMEASARPTRAEASDVFNAVLDGADAVMLSGETAVGRFPIEAVATMNRILIEAEALLPAAGADPGPSPRGNLVTPTTEALVEAAATAARRLHAALLIVATHSGRTALALSKLRHPTPILAVSDVPEVTRALALCWGVTPIQAPADADPERVLAEAIAWARARGLARAGDRVVMLRGTVPGDPVHNAMLVQELA